MTGRLQAHLRERATIKCDPRPTRRLVALLHRTVARAHTHCVILAVLLCPFIVQKEIDLTNPRLGSELLKDPKGDFPLDVWEAYCSKPFAHLGPLYLLSVLSWRTDPSDPKTAALDPQEAVDEAMTSAVETHMLLKSNQPAEAMESAKRTVTTLARGASFCQPKRGQPASMRPIAVRAWIIRKFNPTLSLAKVADLLFLEDRKCPRCNRTKHQYNSPCVNALSTAVRNLCIAMEHDQIPL